MWLLGLSKWRPHHRSLQVQFRHPGLFGRDIVATVNEGSFETRLPLGTYELSVSGCKMPRVRRYTFVPPRTERLRCPESGYAHRDSPAQLVAPSHASSGSGLPFEAFERRYSNDSISLVDSRLRSDDFPALDGSSVRAVLRLWSDDSRRWHADLCSTGRHPGDGGRLRTTRDRGRRSAGRRRGDVRGRHA